MDGDKDGTGRDLLGDEKKNCGLGKGLVISDVIDEDAAAGNCRSRFRFVVLVGDAGGDAGASSSNTLTRCKATMQSEITSNNRPLASCISSRSCSNESEADESSSFTEDGNEFIEDDDGAAFCIATLHAS